MNISIIGAGNLGHAIAVASSHFFGKTSILTSSVESSNREIVAYLPEEKKIVGRDVVFSGNPEEVISSADVVLLTVPSNIISSKLSVIKPYLKKNAIVGSVVASGGFFWMAKKILGENARLFAFQRVPFICRIGRSGSYVNITGLKKELFMTHLGFGMEKDGLFSLIKKFEKSFLTKIFLLDSYLESTISNSNPILHTSRLFSLLSMDTLSNPLFFYGDWDLQSSEMLLGCDSEIGEILSRLPVPFPHFKSLKEHYEVADAEEMTEKLSSIKAFQSITFPLIEKGPKVSVPDPDNRYFREDLPYGLLILKAIAQITNVRTPNFDKIIFKLQEFIEKNYLSSDGTLSGSDIGHSGIPQNFGVTTLEKLVNL